MKGLKILLADDHPIILKGLAAFLTEKGFKDVLAAHDGSEAWELIQANQPDICILDIEMPGLTGLEILELCQTNELKCKIILLSYYNSPGFIALARQKGAAGYLGKENSIREIEDCIYMVDVEGFYFPEELSGGYVTPGLEVIRKLGTLTERERQVIALILEGMTNRSIAAQLEVSLRTVEKHRSNIINKLLIDQNVTNLSQWALQNKVMLKEALK